MIPWLTSGKRWARRIKHDVVALWIAARDPRTPLAAKLFAGAVAAYALSPIDLIPDFIPVLGYLDDLILVPLGAILAVRMIPADLMAEFRAEASRRMKPASQVGLAIILAIWLVAGRKSPESSLAWSIFSSVLGVASEWHLWLTALLAGPFSEVRRWPTGRRALPSHRVLSTLRKLFSRARCCHRPGRPSAAL